MKHSRVVRATVLVILSALAGRVASQSSPSRPTPKTTAEVANAWMQTPSVGGNVSDVSAAIRSERDTFWDNLSGAREPLTARTASASAMGESWYEPAPEIPKVENRVVLTGTFVAYRSFLTSSRRTIYTEIAFKVDEIFQNRSMSIITPGDNITVAIAGGSALSPSGETLHYLTQPRELFVQPSRKYL